MLYLKVVLGFTTTWVGVHAFREVTAETIYKGGRAIGVKKVVVPEKVTGMVVRREVVSGFKGETLDFFLGLGNKGIQRLGRSINGIFGQTDELGCDMCE